MCLSKHRQRFTLFMVIPTDRMHIFPFFFSQDLLMYVNLIYIKIIDIIDTNGYYICCLSEFFSYI